MPAIAYFLLEKAIVRREGAHSLLAQALGRDVKGKLSVVLYVAGVVLAFIYPWASVAIYVFVALMWFVPDRRIEKTIGKT
jgi:uncharacterized membrane protein